MNFRNENELQLFIHRVIGGQREVTFPSGKRIDILTNKYAVEVKPKLTRDSIYQAMGQLLAYQRFTGARQLVIAGMTPKDEGSSLSTAKEAKASGIDVWYVDKLDIFIEQWNGVGTTSPLLQTQKSLYERLNEIARGHNKPVASVKWPARFQKQKEEPQENNSLFWWGAGLTTVVALALFGQPSAPTTPVRATPSGTIVADIPTEATVAIEACDRDWVLIRWENVTGWVSKSEFDQPVCE